MARGDRLRLCVASLAGAMIACEGEVPRAVAPDEAPETRHASCFGGVDEAPPPARWVLPQGEGWVILRATGGRCAASEVPLELSLARVQGDHRRVLGVERVAPSTAPARASFAWLGWVDEGAALVLEARGATPAFFTDLRVSALRARPADLPARTRGLFARAIETEDGVRAGAPVRLAMRSGRGIHTLSGEIARVDGDASARVAVFRAGTGLPPLSSFRLSDPPAMPFTVSWASARDDAIELAAIAPAGTSLALRDVRLDSALLPEAPPPLREPPPPPIDPRPGLVLALARVAASGVAGPERCEGRPAYVAPSPSTLTLALGPGAWAVRGAVGPCAAEGVSFHVGDTIVEGTFDVDVAAGATEIALVGEGDGRAAWIEARAARVPARVRASGFNESRFNRTYAPENVSDGHPETEWHLPDATPGWIELDLDAPHPVRAVALRNGHNPRYDDRASDVVVLELFEGERRVALAEERFPRMERAPALRVVRIPRAPRADRVRVSVRSWHGLGGALAAVEIL